MGNAQRLLNRHGKKLEKVGKKLSLGLTVPLLALGVVAVKTYADFQQELAKVEAISGATDTQMQKLKKTALDLGATTRFTSTQVAGLQLNLSKLGFDPGEIIAASGAILDLAVATGEDLAESATVAASTLRGFQLSATDSGRVADVMAASFSGSALNLEKFKTAMAVLAPVANTANRSLEQTTGMLAVLVNAGIDASTAGTGLRNIFLDIAKRGITLEAALSKINNSSNKNATSMALFGKRGATVATVLAQNIGQARAFAKEFDNAGGSAKRMAEIMDNTLTGSFLRLRSALEAVAISFTEEVAPYIKSLSEKLATMALRFRELSPETKKFIIVLAGIAAAVGPLLVFVGTVLPAIGTGLALLTGPIGLTVAALAAIGVVIYKNWEPIKQTLVDIANYFIDLYNESTVFRIGVEGIILHFKNLYAVGSFVFSALGDIISTVGKNIKDNFKSIGGLVKAILTGDIKQIPTILADGFKKGFGNNKELINKLGEQFKVLKTKIGDNIEEGISAALSKKKYELLGDTVDTENLEEKVEKSLAPAVEKGLKAGSDKWLAALEQDLDFEEIEIFDVQGTEDFIAGLGGRLDEALASANTQNFENFLSSLQELDGTELDDYAEKLAAFDKKLKETQENAQAVGSAVGDAFENMTGKLTDSLDLADSGFEGFVKGMLGTITKLISMLLANSIANAIAGASASGAATGPAAIFTTPAFIATAVGGVLAAFSAIPKFATGGIVGGSSFFGDLNLARVNAGELILNLAQQSNLAGILRAGNNITLLPSADFRGDGMRIMLQRVESNRNRHT